ncbi:MAG UNVERIFIED_CONTAM: glycosyltransferase family 39 protein [Planctomycetaceae bacterium]
MKFSLSQPLLRLGVCCGFLQIEFETVEHFDEGVYASVLWYDGLFGSSWPGREYFAPPGLPTLIELTSILPGLQGLAPFVPGLVFGTLTPLLFWWTARFWFGMAAGLFVLMISTCSEFHITYSRMALTDVPAARIGCGIRCGGKFCHSSQLSQGGLRGGRNLRTGVVDQVHRLAATRDPHQRKSGVVDRGWSSNASSPTTPSASWGDGFNSWHYFPSLLVVAAVHRRLLGCRCQSRGLSDELATVVESPQRAVGISNADGRVLGSRIGCGRNDSCLVRSRHQSAAFHVERIVCSEAAVVASDPGGNLCWTALPASPHSHHARLYRRRGLSGMFLQPVFRTTEKQSRSARWLWTAVSPGEAFPIGFWLSLAWVVGLLAATPFYQPYSRLMLPLIAGVWLAAAGGISWWLDSQLMAFSHQQPRFRLPRTVDFGRRLLIAGLLMAAFGSSMIVPDGNGNAAIVTLDDVSGSPIRQDRRDIRRAAFEIAKECVWQLGGKQPSKPAMDAEKVFTPSLLLERRDTEDVISEAPPTPAELQSLGAVLYVYGEPALAFHLQSLGLTAVPVAHIAVDAAADGAAVFLIFGPNARRTPGFWEQWQTEEARFEWVDDVYYRPGPVTLTDLFSAKYLSTHSEALQQRFEVYCVRKAPLAAP